MYFLKDPGALLEEIALAAAARADSRDLKDLEETNLHKVLAAFQAEEISDFHFAGSTGYGYDDRGRAALDRVYARVFGAESALVRPHLVSGTHAIATALFGLLRPGQELLCVGQPYDTLKGVIGGLPGSLEEWGVSRRLVPWNEDLAALEEEVRRAVAPQTEVVLLQRSRGYSPRRALRVAELGRLIAAIKEAAPWVTVLVDNCYGEFTEVKEPTEVGADLVAGSLIKNPGGGLAPTGGYLAGRADLVELAQARLTAPGLGGELGAYPPGYRLYFQGLFLAPHFTVQALTGAAFTAAFFEALGFETSPRWDEERSDIIQSIVLKRREALLSFAATIQKASPVDSRHRPEPGPLPGYGDEGVVMAAGTFVQGASLELSADGPVREPYIVYLQPGLVYAHCRMAVTEAARVLAQKGFLPA